jgi:hypothetical protein
MTLGTLLIIKSYKQHARNKAQKERRTKNDTKTVIQETNQRTMLENKSLRQWNLRDLIAYKTAWTFLNNVDSSRSRSDQHWGWRPWRRPWRRSHRRRQRQWQWHESPEELPEPLQDALAQPASTSGWSKIKSQNSSAQRARTLFRQRISSADWRALPRRTSGQMHKPTTILPTHSGIRLENGFPQ